MRLFYIAIWCLSLSACGGGSSTPNPTTPEPSADDVGCTQEYYQTLIGKYSGVLELNEPGQMPRSCQWNTEIEITGSSELARCLLRTSTQATVTQLTFYPEDDLNRYQCLDDNGERTVSESIGPSFSSTELPGLDNSNFPVEIGFSKNNLIDRGYYFGDEMLTARYLNLFDGSLSELARQIIVEGDETISVRTFTGDLLGTLVKDQ